MKYDYKDLIDYMGLDKIPASFEEAYGLYESEETEGLLPRSYYNELLAPYNLPDEKRQYLDCALSAIENDKKVLSFSKFFVWIMCSVRDKYDIDGYTELVPTVLGEYSEAYAFLVSLACVPVAEKDMIRRGVPKEYYEDIPHRMLRDQIRRYLETGKINVEDMPWRMNFYTLSIFLLDRFLFIAGPFEDSFRLYRNKNTRKVVGIQDAGCVVDSEGQLVLEDAPCADESKPGTGHVYARQKAIGKETFLTTVTETENEVCGYYMNPCGFVENKKVTLSKEEYEIALDKKDCLLGFHIPSGEGYTPERMRNSMKLAMDFYKKYYPELQVKGFWSESWLYDKRLSFLIGKGKNITNVSEEMFCFSGGWDGEMLYVHLFQTMETNLEACECKTTLQKNARRVLLEGGRFCSTGMVFLEEELENGNHYFTPEDEASFYEMMKINSMYGGLIC